MLDGRDKSFGREHPDTLFSIRALALVLQDYGKYEAAEEMKGQALEGEKALEPDHPDRQFRYSTLAMVLRD